MPGSIQLGLQRITRLLGDFQQTWPAIHVAGTNGKGSVCAYIAAMLRRARMRTGRFASPHLIDRWDGITINDKVVEKQLFEETENKVKAWNESQKIGASPFEILTATAFHIFDHEKVDMAVVECGMGGREDATNVLQNTMATVITHIGLDHQEFLGNTLEEIAYQKAGIIKPGAPCIISRLKRSVRSVIVAEARRQGKVSIRTPAVSPVVRLNKASKSLLAAHSIVNMNIAARVVESIWPNLARSGHETFQQISYRQQIYDDLAPAMLDIQIPGRLQNLNIECLTGRESAVLIDGAHNPDAWEALARYVDHRFRWDKPNRSTTPPPTSPVTWVLSQSMNAHKSPADMIQKLCKPGDCIFATGFGPVDGMPWVKPAPLDQYAVPESWHSHPEATQLRTSQHESLLEVLKMATDQAQERPIIIAGSLYMVSDVMRLMRNAGFDCRNVDER